MSETKYIKKDPISHVLDRSDVYIGSIVPEETEHFICSENMKIEKKVIKISPGFLRILIEPLSNAIDNLQKSKDSGIDMTYIMVEIEKDGTTVIKNDGSFIPVEKHETEKCYNHTLLFGHLLTSSNYDDTQERKNISGRNGLGVKCTNIFSTKFIVEGADSKNKKKFTQEWSNNMKKCGKPIITNFNLKHGFTKITFLPDFKRFKMTGYTQEIIDLIRKYLADTAMNTNLDVYLNNEKIQVSSLEDYAKMYMHEETPYIYIKNQDSNLVLAESKEYNCISFVNGIYTPLGGTHVNPWIEEILRPVLKKIVKKEKQYSLKELKQNFTFFVTASVVNPTFESQSKNMLKSPTISVQVSKKHIATICKWPFVTRVKNDISRKELKELKKVERKKGKHVIIEGLDRANNEGDVDCSLILVEGLSAKTYAVNGIFKGIFGKKGRDWYGIYPMRGKLLNTRNATVNSISKNSVITNIIQALNLKVENDYTEESKFKTLRYGKVIMITDADVDGIHITGLIMNLFHSLFPSLLKRKDPFLFSMQTPIVRLYLDKTSILFYDENQYKLYVKKYKKKNPQSNLIHKYYKGLGTSSNEDIKETFGVKMVKYFVDEKTDELMDKLFGKTNSDYRKGWLETYNQEKQLIEWDENKKEVKQVSVTNFLDIELIKHSYENCKRSIPSLIDGLKESQRKVLFIALGTKSLSPGIKKPQKVEQIAALVAQKSGYHHGSANLEGVFTNMARNYVGSNNIPYFTSDGQFGTRLEGGKDVASSRYIYSSLEYVTKIIFDPKDTNLLVNRNDDGESVEPYFYVPIIPTVLVNGTSCSIGTGWSSYIPCHNPMDLIDNIKLWLKGKEMKELFPWYKGFIGTIEKEGENKYVTKGIFQVKGNKVVITELPIGTWTSDYKMFLEKLIVEKQLESYTDDAKDDSKIHFVLYGLEFEPTFESLQLTSTMRTTNMCLFDKDEKLKKYKNTKEILEEYCKVRYEYYTMRKESIVKKLQQEITFLGNKKKFLMQIKNNEIKLFDEKKKGNEFRKKSDLVKELESLGYEKIFPKTDSQENEKDDDDDENNKEKDSEEEEKEKDQKGYDYLLKLSFQHITIEKIKKLTKDISFLEKELKKILSSTEKDLWLEDLDKFVEEYNKMD